MKVEHKGRDALSENASVLTETPWAYLKVRQTEYEKLQPTLFADLFNGVPQEKRARS